MGLLSSIGGLIGLAVGGPLGAAIGSGIGSLAGGGDIGDALKAGVLGFGIGSIPGAQGFVQGAAGSMGLNALAGGAGGQAGGGSLAALFGGGAGAGAGAGGGGAGGLAAALTGGGQGAAAVNPLAALTGGAAGGGAGLGSGIMGFAQQNPLIMAALMQAAEPNRNMLSPEQERQLDTGESLPDYRGTAAPDPRRMGSRNFAMGGFIEGPGTGTSDSIPARIYQNGGPVQEAALSDGEFVMTADAVRGMGNGNRNAGAAKMYEMMNRLERRA
jgi:hypothetical protein